MAYRKTVAGTANQSNETASHNKIIIEPGYAGTYLVLFVCILVTGSIIFMWVAHADILQDLVVSTFLGIFGCAWFFAIQFIRRTLSQVRTDITINDAAMQRALLESSVVAMTDHYILYKDEKGRYQFQASAFVTENRHYPAQIEAPVSHQETILELYDHNQSARGIEKLLKDKKVSYYQIQKTLDLFRPGWTDKAKRVVDSEQPYED